MWREVAHESLPSTNKLETCGPVGSVRTDKLRTARVGQICTRPSVQFQLVAWTTSKKAVAAICRIQDYIYTPEEGKDPLGIFEHLPRSHWHINMAISF